MQNVSKNLIKLEKFSLISTIMIAIIIPFSFFTQKISYSSEKLKVVASFYPLAHFAAQVGAEHVEVINIMPPGAEPHEFEPTPRDIKKIYDSMIFLFHGAGIDSWAERIHIDVKKKGILTLDMTEHFDFARIEKKRGHEAEFGYEHYHHGENDPHIWLDPFLARKEVEIIRDVFIKADPLHEETYRENSDVYIKKLNVLNEKYKSGLKSCAKRDIIVTHDAFNYLTRRYNLKAHPITGISPEEEPSPRKMVELSKLVLKKNIKYIFFERLVSPKLAETIAHEVGAKTLILNPLGGLTKEDIREGKTYISVMEENLHNLHLALECE
jgi:zinc transport system substrate-binding protein